MIKEVASFNYIDKLYVLKLWSLEERRNRQDLIELYKMYKGISLGCFDKLFVLDTGSKGTRGHSVKLVKPKCLKDVRKHFFSHRVIIRWNALDEGSCPPPLASINAFKCRLSQIRDH